VSLRLLPESIGLTTDTAFVKDAKGWKFAEDSRISKAQEKDIVVSPALTDQHNIEADPSPVKHICCMSPFYILSIRSAADEQVL
jgi:hypothetical protein